MKISQAQTLSNLRAAALFAVFSLSISTQVLLANAPSGTRIGEVVEVHGLAMPSGNGKYWQWASGSDGMIGWLKQNSDGSSHQLIAQFSPPTAAGVSQNLSSLYVYDSKTGARQNLLPSSGVQPWVISWVGPAFTIFNRTVTGTTYGARGVPSAKIHTETTAMTENPSYSLLVTQLRGAEPPTASGGPSRVCTYRVALSSSRALPASMELRIFIDDAAGKTVMQDRRPITRSATIPSNALTEVGLGARYSTLPDGLYTINFEVIDRLNRQKFLTGATKAVEIKTTTGIR